MQTGRPAAVQQPMPELWRQRTRALSFRLPLGVANDESCTMNRYLAAK